MELKLEYRILLIQKEMKNEIFLTKETKILLLEVLKRGILTRYEAEQLTRPFENHITIIEAKEFLNKLNSNY